MSYNRRWSPRKSAWCPIIQTDQRSDEDKHSISGHPKFRCPGSSGFRYVNAGSSWCIVLLYRLASAEPEEITAVVEASQLQSFHTLSLWIPGWEGSPSIGVLFLSKNSNVSCPLILTLSLLTWSCSTSLYRSEFLLCKEYSSIIL